MKDSSVRKPGPRRVRMLPAPKRRRRPAFLSSLWVLHWLAAAASACAFYWLVTLGTRTSLLLGLGFGMGSLTLLSMFRGWIRVQHEFQMRKRLEALSGEMLSGGSLTVRGTPPALYALIGFLLATYLWLRYARDMPSGLGILTLLAIPLLLGFWTRGLRYLVAPVLVMDRDGFSTPRLGRVSWSQVVSIQVADQTPLISRTSFSVVFTFAAGQHPRGAGSWARRNLRGIENDEEFVHLRNASEDPLVIRGLAEILKAAARHSSRSAVPARESAPYFDFRTSLDTKYDLTGLPPTIYSKPARARRDAPGSWGGTPKDQWWVVLSAFGALGIMAFAVLREFFHAPAWASLSRWMSLAFGIALGIWWLTRLLPRVPARSRLGISLILPCFAILFVYTLLGRALPDVYTHFAGEPFQMMVPGYRYVSCGRRCHYNAMVPVFGPGNEAQRVNLWRRDFDRLPEKGEYLVSGESSWFGRHVERVESAADFR